MDDKIKRGAATRERILDEALALFAKRGFGAVSVRDIAAAVGIKDASLYNHFPSKQALFDAIVQRELVWLQKAFEPQGVMFDPDDDPSGYDPRDPAALRTRVLESYRRFFEDERLRLLRQLLVVNQYESEAVGRAYRFVFIDRPLALQRVVFENCMVAGAFALGDAAQMALEFHGPVFLMLHAGMSWEVAVPKIEALLDAFTARHQVAPLPSTAGLVREDGNTPDRSQRAERSGAGASKQEEGAGA